MTFYVVAIPKMHQNRGNHIYQIKNFLGDDPQTPRPCSFSHIRLGEEFSHVALWW